MASPRRRYRACNDALCRNATASRKASLNVDGVGGALSVAGKWVAVAERSGTVVLWGMPREYTKVRRARAWINTRTCSRQIEGKYRPGSEQIKYPPVSAITN